MDFAAHLTATTALAVSLAVASGCSQRPSAVYAPYVDAVDASAKAMSLYDTNHDGFLDEKELEACPGILGSLGVYDADGDHQISREEIENRIGSWATAGPGMMSVECRVTLDGRPLGGATVRFIPEPYLEGSIKPASGVTRDNGIASISLAADDLPSQLKRAKAMNAGTYRVEITHPTAKIPDRYNVHTVLGRDVSKQTVVSPFDEFKLKGK